VIASIILKHVPLFAIIFVITGLSLHAVIHDTKKGKFDNSEAQSEAGSRALIALKRTEFQNRGYDTF
jgi:hypothetical protein